MKKPTSVAMILTQHVDAGTATRINQLNDAGMAYMRALDSLKNADPRMVAIARTHFQTSAMYALHAVVVEEVITG